MVMLLFFCSKLDAKMWGGALKMTIAREMTAFHAFGVSCFRLNDPPFRKGRVQFLMTHGM